MQRIVIIDYGMGNIHSVSKALEHVAPQSRIVVSHEPEALKGADRILFPGVGAIRDCIDGLKQLGMAQALRDFMLSGKPVLAVCVGLQALMRHSEENNGVDCLAWFPGNVHGFSQRFADCGIRHELKVPHMGWSQLDQKMPHRLWEGIPQNARFYFVHSYFAELDDQSLLAGQTTYGVPFAAAVAKDNVFATQFHPEKSQRWGLQLLENFSRWKI